MVLTLKESRPTRDGFIRYWMPSDTWAEGGQRIVYVPAVAFTTGNPPERLELTGDGLRDGE